MSIADRIDTNVLILASLFVRSEFRSWMDRLAGASHSLSITPSKSRISCFVIPHSRAYSSKKNLVFLTLDIVVGFNILKVCPAALNSSVVWGLGLRNILRSAAIILLSFLHCKYNTYLTFTVTFPLVILYFLSLSDTTHE